MCLLLLTADASCRDMRRHIVGGRRASRRWLGHGGWRSIDGSQQAAAEFELRSAVGVLPVALSSCRPLVQVAFVQCADLFPLSLSLHSALHCSEEVKNEADSGDRRGSPSNSGRKKWLIAHCSHPVDFSPSSFCPLFASRTRGGCLQRLAHSPDSHNSHRSCVRCPSPPSRRCLASVLPLPPLPLSTCPPLLPLLPPAPPLQMPCPPSLRRMPNGERS